VTAARLLYARAAEAGSAQGARLVARTYDDAYLTAADVATLADPEAARTWYGRAAALGDAEAARRLKAMQEGR
jgi:TPR repeat protein